MSDETNNHLSAVRSLKQQWDGQDEVRDKLELEAKKIFLEQQATEVFAPIENYITKLQKVVSAFGVSVEISPTWMHLDNQRLQRAVEVNSTEPVKKLVLNFTIQGASVFYRDRSYQLSYHTEMLMRVIARDVEQFLTR